MAELVTLSPVHIGSGEKLTTYDFVFMDDVLTIINIDAFLSRNPQRAEEFYQQASSSRFSLSSFLREKEVSAYKVYSIQSPREPKEVNAAIKNAHSEVYIPGSSIKGAIRTALACYFLSRADEETWQMIEEGKDNTDIRGIKQVKGKGAEKKAGKEIEKVIFGCGFKKNDKIIYGDAKFDLMKLITVRDASALPPEECLSLSLLKVYSINNGRAFVKGFETFVESIKPGTAFRLKIDVDTKFIARAEDMEREVRWIGLKDKLERYFGISAGEDERVAERKVLKTIRRACEFFAERVIEKELSIFPEGFYVHTACGHGVKPDFKRRDMKYCPRCNRGGLSQTEVAELGAEVREFYRAIKTKTLLRLGFSTGWYSHTIGVMLEDEFLNYVRHRFKLGKARYREFPKTRRLAFGYNGQVYPMGWVEIKGVEK